MQSLSTLFAALALFSSANAHMSLSWPPPFRSALNPNVAQSSIDYSITSPLDADGSNFPCKGYQSDLGSSNGKSVATWVAGTQYNFTVLGSAVHGGGSCQAALSYDKGVSWKVIHSYQGSCPLSDGEKFDFTIPSDAPSTGSDGTIFAWLWYNEVGNREIYMSCASVTVNAASSSASAPSTAYSSRPDIFVANLGNGCTTVEGKEVQFPNPGPDADVTNKYTVTDDSGSFTGTCSAVNGIGGETASSSSSSSNSTTTASGEASSASSAASSSQTTTMATSASSAVSSSQPTTMATSVSSAASLSNPTSSQADSAGVFATVSALSTAVEASSSSAAAVSSAPVSTGTGTASTSGLTVSEDGQCSGAHTCEGSPHGPCCSQWGWCGSTSDYCGTGCQAGFGQCGSFVNSTSSSAGSAAPSGASRKLRFRA